ncbi:MAG: non-hydrolyzing UDP-N-acetylglucosamine 2-epimerase [Clostridia bacterium]|jgi:UDP-N-acetylglucosamine 2-epimerase (non-hydrolysing)
MLKVMPIFGTRPEAIKMAPLIKELESNEFLDTRVVVTAQHREMLDQVLDLFHIQPAYDLDIMEDGQTLIDATYKILHGMKEILEKEKHDMVLVHGDIVTTFAGSLAAFFYQIPIGHVEAGLRSYNKFSPYPEEMNRKLTGSLTDLHFAPTMRAKQNLINEGIPGSQIFVTGNTVIDSIRYVLEDSYQFQDELDSVDFGRKRVILVTAHRRENWGEPMRNIFTAVKKLAELNADIEFIFSMHKNPKVRRMAYEILGNAPRVHLIEPLDYKPFVNLLHKCYFVMTDSGGIQEEAPSLGKPVLLLRDTTERPEAVDAGTVRLVGCNCERIVKEANLLLQNHLEYRIMANAVNPYGDGKASQRIVSSILKYFGMRDSSV